MSADRSAGQGGVVFVRFDFDAVLDGSCVDDGARNALEELGERVDVVAGWPGGEGIAGLCCLTPPIQHDSAAWSPSN